MTIEEKLKQAIKEKVIAVNDDEKPMIVGAGIAAFLCSEIVKEVAFNFQDWCKKNRWIYSFINPDDMVNSARRTRLPKDQVYALFLSECYGSETKEETHGKE
jgi:hypothetical protein